MSGKPRLLLRRDGDAEQAELELVGGLEHDPDAPRQRVGLALRVLRSGSRRARCAARPRRCANCSRSGGDRRSSRCSGRRPARPRWCGSRPSPWRSFRASSTGCTFDLKVRPKPPSKVRSSRVSIGAGSPSQDAPSGAAAGFRGHRSEREEYSRRADPAAMRPAGAGDRPTSVGAEHGGRRTPAASHAAPNQRGARRAEAQQRQAAEGEQRPTTSRLHDDARADRGHQSRRDADDDSDRRRARPGRWRARRPTSGDGMPARPQTSVITSGPAAAVTNRM